MEIGFASGKPNASGFIIASVILLLLLLLPVSLIWWGNDRDRRNRIRKRYADLGNEVLSVKWSFVGPDWLSHRLFATYRVVYRSPDGFVCESYCRHSDNWKNEDDIVLFCTDAIILSSPNQPIVSPPPSIPACVEPHAADSVAGVDDTHDPVVAELKMEIARLTGENRDLRRQLQEMEGRHSVRRQRLKGFQFWVTPHREEVGNLMPMLLLLLIGVAIVCYLCSFAWDRERIREYIESLGGRILDSKWEPEFFESHGEGIYFVRYRDRDGATHEALCKTGVNFGVYFTEDRVVDKSTTSLPSPPRNHSGIGAQPGSVMKTPEEKTTPAPADSAPSLAPEPAALSPADELALLRDNNRRLEEEVRTLREELERMRKQ